MLFKYSLFQVALILKHERGRKSDKIGLHFDVLVDIYICNYQPVVKIQGGYNIMGNERFLFEVDGYFDLRNELRFVFENGNCRIEELDFEGDVVKVLRADGGTVRGFFNIYEKEGSNIETITELEKVAQKY